MAKPRCPKVGGKLFVQAANGHIIGISGLEGSGIIVAGVALKEGVWFGASTAARRRKADMTANEQFAANLKRARENRRDTFAVRVVRHAIPTESGEYMSAVEITLHGRKHELNLYDDEIQKLIDVLQRR